MSENKSLSLIVSQVADIENMLIESEGVITPEIEAILAVKEINLPEKVDSYAAVIERFEMIEEYYKAKSDNILKIARAASAVYSRCKENLKFAMKELGVDEINGHDMRFKLSASKPSIIIEDDSKIDAAYKITETIVKIDKNKIGEDLKIGVPVAGAKMQENFSLRKYANRSSK